MRLTKDITSKLLFLSILFNEQQLFVKAQSNVFVKAQSNVCYDTPDWFDTNGFGCGFYEIYKVSCNPSVMNNWASDGYDASSACCYCDGKEEEGENGGGITVLSSGCNDIAGWADDEAGLTCAQYALYNINCADGFADSNGVTPNQACCYCGGGWTENPTDYPSEVPSDIPSSEPSIFHSDSPSNIHSDAPSIHPSNIHSEAPSLTPSVTSSIGPSNIHSQAPSSAPSDIHSAVPSGSPSMSNQPSGATTTTQTTTKQLEIKTEATDTESIATVIKESLENSLEESSLSSRIGSSFSYSDFTVEILGVECDGSLCVVDFSVTAIVDCGGVCSEVMDTIEETFELDTTTTMEGFFSDGSFIETVIEVAEDLGVNELLDVADIQFDIELTPTATPTVASEDSFTFPWQIIIFPLIIVSVSVIVGVITVTATLGFGGLAGYFYYFWRLILPEPVGAMLSPAEASL